MEGGGCCVLLTLPPLSSKKSVSRLPHASIVVLFSKILLYLFTAVVDPRAKSLTRGRTPGLDERRQDLEHLVQIKASTSI